MSIEEHYRKLEKMYLSAPINKYFNPSIEVKQKIALISIKVNPEMFHSAGGLHGSVYFKMLDDAAFFAANSLENEYFVLTATFTVKLVQPVISGTLKCVGKIVKAEESKWVAESVLYNDDVEVGFGSGIFMRGKLRLREAMGYC